MFYLEPRARDCMGLILSGMNELLCIKISSILFILPVILRYMNALAINSFSFTDDHSSLSPIILRFVIILAHDTVDLQTLIKHH